MVPYKNAYRDYNQSRTVCIKTHLFHMLSQGFIENKHYGAFQAVVTDVLKKDAAVKTKSIRTYDRSLMTKVLG